MGQKSSHFHREGSYFVDAYINMPKSSVLAHHWRRLIHPIMVVMVFLAFLEVELIEKLLQESPHIEWEGSYIDNQYT